MCCFSQFAALYPDLDKFKLSVSICFNDVLVCVLCGAHLVCLCLHMWTNVSTSVCVCVHFAHAGLRDHYSRDHLFSGMWNNSKRSSKYSAMQEEEGGR